MNLKKKSAFVWFDLKAIFKQKRIKENVFSILPKLICWSQRILLAKLIPCSIEAGGIISLLWELFTKKVDFPSRVNAWTNKAFKMSTLLKLNPWEINCNCEASKQRALTEKRQIVIDVRHSFTKRNDMKPNSFFNENSL